jgi:hypothetical protein
VAEMSHSGASTIDHDLRLALPVAAVSDFKTNVVENGSVEDGSLGLYDVNANIGDWVSFDVHPTTPATPAGVSGCEYSAKRWLLSCSYD